MNDPRAWYGLGMTYQSMAANAFDVAGYDAHNMTGGLLEWHDAGLPLEPADGYVADS